MSRQHYCVCLMILGLSAILTAIPVTSAAGLTLHRGTAASVGMSPTRLKQALAFLRQRVAAGGMPGAAVLIARRGVVVAQAAYGTRHPGSSASKEQVKRDTLFDVQSISKVLSTSIVALALAEQGKLRLDDPVSHYLPDFDSREKAGVTIRDLLSFSAGLPNDADFSVPLPHPVRPLSPLMREQAMTGFLHMGLTVQPRHQVLYSDLGYRILGTLLEKAGGHPLDYLAQSLVFDPLGMTDTHYFPQPPTPSLLKRVAATGYSETRQAWVQGQVSEDPDYLMGGIVGDDGIFSTVWDTAILAQALLNHGQYGSRHRLLSPESVRLLTTNQTPWVTATVAQEKGPYQWDAQLDNLLLTPKGLGWELMTPRYSACGTKLSHHTFLKEGGAGTFVCVDPDQQLIVVLYTNHGEPADFMTGGWQRMIRQDIQVGTFMDMVAKALEP